MSESSLRLGIIGGGQLARMMAAAGKRIGIDCSFFVESESSAESVVGFGEIVVMKDGESSAELYKRLGSPQFITIDKEDVPGALLTGLAEHCPVSPNCDALAVLCDKAEEKLKLQQLGIPTVSFAVATDKAAVQAGVDQVGLPVVVKAATSGYDGKNQWVLKTAEDLAKFLTTYDGTRVVVEDFIPFDTEVSLIGARSSNGETVFYPMAENAHQSGVLVKSIAPAPEHLQRLVPTAKQYLETLFEQLGYIGIMSVEFFVHENRLLINEIAPRVHNSGHWTMDADICDQFENHLRAILVCRLAPLTPLKPSRC